MSSIIFNRSSFNIQTNSKRTEQEFVNKWNLIAFMDVKADTRDKLLREAYALVCKAAGVEPKGVFKLEELVPEVTEDEEEEIPKFSEHQSDEQPEEIKSSYKPRGRR